jgi:hypothetical protein
LHFGQHERVGSDHLDRARKIGRSVGRNTIDKKLGVEQKNPLQDFEANSASYETLLQAAKDGNEEAECEVADASCEVRRRRRSEANAKFTLCCLCAKHFKDSQNPYQMRVSAYPIART